MNNKQFYLIIIFLYINISAVARAVSPDSIFCRFLKQGEFIANNFPREKAYLHFDNTSYYTGDTIWFKAYVTIAENNVLSNLSRPLYVELLDQAGNITDKQIVKIVKGTGVGQMVLRKDMLSGYYEIRAYTKWMLGFTEPNYFSRIFPIYKLSISDNLVRNITNYDLSQSMKKRPEMDMEDFSLRFFPESGSLIEGVMSRVAFKGESRKKLNPDFTGCIYSHDGEILTNIQSSHNGMGDFYYIPSKEPATAKIQYDGKEYTFELPESHPVGYTMKVINANGALDIYVRCGKDTPTDTVAVFIAHQGRPYTYKTINFSDVNEDHLMVRTSNLPKGVVQITLINHKGHVLCERFVYLYPRHEIRISVEGKNKVYAPYERVNCKLTMKDIKGNPIKGNLSVSIMDALRSDYSKYDNNIFTDLLFTSDLKGYIQNPGYYFTDITPKKIRELDILMLIHAWRKYDMENITGKHPFSISCLPEQNLEIRGKVTSTIFKKPLENIELSVVLKKKDKGLVTGITETDTNGNFSIPLEDFEGSEEVLIQTRRQNKKKNKDTSILLYRNFSPQARKLNIEEVNPQWDGMDSLHEQVKLFDSLYMDSISKLVGIYMINEIVIESKRNSISTRVSEQSIDAYYDVRRCVDELRDNGKIVRNIPEFLEMMNSQFFWDRKNDTYSYRQKPLLFIMNGKILSSVERKMILTEIDGLSSIIICKGGNSFDIDMLQNSSIDNIDNTMDAQSFEEKKSEENLNDIQKDDWNKMKMSMKSKEENKLSDITKYIFVYLTPQPYKNIINTNQTAALGTRRTILQGYTPVLDYYKPSYPVIDLIQDKKDKRRTLFWDPYISTDENGEAFIEFYNNQYSTILILKAETITDDGRVGSITYTMCKSK